MTDPEDGIKYVEVDGYELKLADEWGGTFYTAEAYDLDGLAEMLTSGLNKRMHPERKVTVKLSKVEIPAESHIEFAL